MERLVALGLTIMTLSLAACQGPPTGSAPHDGFTAKDTAVGGIAIPDGVDTSQYTQGAAAGLAGANTGATSGMGSSDMALLGASMGAGLGGMGMGNMGGLTMLGASMGPSLGAGMGSGMGLTNLGGISSGTAGLGGFGGFPVL
jgi:hypothetical protein